MTRAGDIKRFSTWQIGVLIVVLIAIGFFLSFTKSIPFVGGGYEARVVFPSAQNVRADSPVRIAGVDVGTVTEVAPLAETDAAAEEESAQEGGSDATSDGSGAESGAVVTLELSDSALPIKTDATFKLRPRLFLEGNLFVELKPGSPSAPEAEDGHLFPMEQASNSVQLDQILTGAFQLDSRRNLQLFLDQFGAALIDHGGAEGFRQLYRSAPGAFKSTSQVNEAFLGTEPHDLSRLIKGLGRTVRGLGRNERALQGFVSNFRTVTGSFAAEDANLERAIAELPAVLEAADPAFANLNAAFPPLRAFAREALPGTLTADETLRQATPLIRQLRLLARPQELRGLAAELRLAIPDLARLTQRQRPFLEQSRALASCFNNVIIPWSNDTVVPVDPANEYDHDPVGRVFEETAYGLVGIGGESRSGDANGQYIRVQAGGGTNTIEFNPVDESGVPTGETLAGVTPFEILGAMPGLDDSAKTPFRPKAPCENQETPNLQAGVGAAPPQNAVAPSATRAPGAEAELQQIAELAQRAAAAKQDGDRRQATRIESRIGRIFHGGEGR